MIYNHCPPKQLPNLISETQSNGTRFYVTPNGIKLPSVTTVVGAKKKKSIMEWRNRVGEQEANRISKLATGRGNRVHDLAERYLKNEKIDWQREMPDSVMMFRSLIPLMLNINNIHYIEQALWSEKVGLAGRVDLIAEWNGVLSVIDFKTSKRIKQKEDIPEYFAQCTAYAAMYEELVGSPIDQLVVVMAVEDEKPIVFVEKTEDHLENLVEHIDFYHKSVA
jgi:genome maintenance exonuclease 1